MIPCPKCGEQKYLGLQQYAAVRKPDIFQVHCHGCKFKGPERASDELAEEAWNDDPLARFEQLQLI